MNHRIMCRTLATISTAQTLDQLLTAERYAKLAIRRIDWPVFRTKCESALNESFHRIRGHERLRRERGC